MKRKAIDYISPTQKITFSFLGVIIIGAILLSLPICSKDRNSINFIDALFISTSATCVTGLVTKIIMHQFNLLGQIIILALIQIGGIGFMTLVISFTVHIKHHISMKDKILLKQQLNQTNLTNIKQNLHNVLKYMFIIEALGAILLFFKFIPNYGVLKGIFFSIFITVSAFCNAGFDNLTTTSLIPFSDDVYILIIVMCLIILGGLGFIVWFDIKDKLRLCIQKKCSFPYLFQSFSLHTKIVLIMTILLIICPTIIFLVIEYHSSFFEGQPLLYKIINTLFTSITLRTAGFTSIPIEQCHPASIFIMILCMFIGGSPGGTAGGIKTTTLAVIILCVICSLKGKRNTNVFYRHISSDIIVQATTIFTLNLCTLFISVFLLLCFEPFDFIAILFECTSALATVGLSMGITSLLSPIGKVILIVLMFIGRIGIITFVMSIVRESKKENDIQYASGNIIIG